MLTWHEIAVETVFSVFFSQEVPHFCFPKWWCQPWISDHGNYSPASYCQHYNEYTRLHILQWMADILARPTWLSAKSSSFLWISLSSDANIWCGARKVEQNFNLLLSSSSPPTLHFLPYWLVVWLVFYSVHQNLWMQFGSSWKIMITHCLNFLLYHCIH